MDNHPTYRHDQANLLRRAIRRSAGWKPLSLFYARTLVVIASNYGQRNNPSWYHNMRAQPRTTVQFDGVTREMTARELDGADRERWYERGIEIYPGWVQYRKRASHRNIPVMELSAGA